MMGLQMLSIEMLDLPPRAGATSGRNAAIWMRAMAISAHLPNSSMSNVGRASTGPQRCQGKCFRRTHAADLRAKPSPISRAGDSSRQPIVRRLGERRRSRCHRGCLGSCPWSCPSCRIQRRDERRRRDFALLKHASKGFVRAVPEPRDEQPTSALIMNRPGICGGSNS